MQKAIIVGCSGSGKSTLSRKIHTLTGLPLYHLDNIFWRADKTHISREEFDRKLAEILHRDSWILDGDYNRTYEPRIAACDTVIFLDYAEEVCMEGITNRVGQKREDKWIVSLGDRDYADEEILEAIHFQEKYFEGELLR